MAHAHYPALDPSIVLVLVRVVPKSEILVLMMVPMMVLMMVLVLAPPVVTQVLRLAMAQVLT